jgi:RNA polymerase sigma factor (sigma-70 family)
MTSDATLARAAALGDREAFEQLYRRYSPGLFGFVLRQVGSHHAAEDIVQECFLIAWRDLGKLRDPTVVKTWLFSIAYRRSMSHASRAVHLPLAEAANIVDDNPARHPEAAAEQHEAQELVWNAAKSLASRQRAVIELSVRWSMSSREIGEVVGVGPSHAAVLVHRANSALRHAIKVNLTARQRHRCRGLHNLLPATHRTLTARQRSSVDHHIRRCPDCQRFNTQVSSYATLAVVLGHPRPSAAAVHSGSWALKLGVAAALTGVVAIGTVAYAAGGTTTPSSSVADTVVTTAPEIPQPSVPSATPEPTPTPTPTPSSTPSSTPKPAPASSAAAPSRSPASSPRKLSPEEEMVTLINKVRANAGCGPVASNSNLASAAALHSKDMADNAYFSHTSLDGRSPWDRAKAAGYEWPSAENIAAGNSTAAATMDQFMNSSGHKANILNCSHKAVGVGRATGGPYGFYWTQLFGSR